MSSMSCIYGSWDLPDQDASSVDGSLEGSAGLSPMRCGAITTGMVDAGEFCIDETEVTQKDYAFFLAARAGDTSGQPPECAFNTSFAPLSSAGCGFDPNATPGKPVSVNQCSASAYCRWANKRLCGRLASAGGGPTPTSERTNAKVSQWFSACSNGGDGLHPYPYGITYLPNACNGGDHDAGLVAVGTLPNCVGGLPNLFDMSGNVKEWEDSCEGGDASDGSNDLCGVNGGNFASTSGALKCGAGLTATRSNGNCGFGFRCCADR
jgi:formylglycine-generating enzyme required for sulfatase activity